MHASGFLHNGNFRLPRENLFDSMPRMNANENQCPLVAYLAKRGESINSFSVRADVGKTAIYNLVAGKTDDPHGSVLLAIERATKGAVTMTAIMEWLADRVLAETETRGEHG